jgi:hypothetical protein
LNTVRQLPGLSLSLAGDTSIVQSLLTGLFGLCPLANGPGDAHLECRRVGDGRAPKWLAAPSDETTRLLAGPGGEVGVTEAGAGGPCSAWLDAARQHVVLAVPESGSYAPLTVLGPLLRELLLDRDRVLIHSGCVARPDGAGILLLADGGGGKTTATAALLHAGCRLLGDDLNALRAEDRGIEAEGWPEPLNVTDATAAFFPELAAALAAVPRRADWHKRTVPPQAAFGETCLAERCRLATACVLRIAREGPALRRMAASEALDFLFAAHRMHRDQPIGRRAFDVLTTLAARVPVFELLTGPNPRDLGRWLMSRPTAALL